jgi:hypothetical protein
MKENRGINRKKAVVERYLTATPVAFLLFTLVSFTVLGWFWSVRDYHYIQAESGFGYLLGIVGGSLMLVLLLYPLRKRLKIMRQWLDIKRWFQMHMLLGVVGPICILLHSNFQLGSANSSIALMAMLLVAGSGLIGRYFYGKFHYGLYGKQVALKQIKLDLDGLYQEMEEHSSSEQKQRLKTLYLGSCKIINSQQQEVSLRQLIKQRHWLRKMRQQALTAEKSSLVVKTQEQVLHSQYHALAGLLGKLSSLRIFERLFGLWHVVHIPVFLLMIVTAIIHIFVVHWY